MPIISNLLQASVALLAALSGVSAAPLERRGVIGHADVIAFSTTIPGGAVGEVYKAYQPYLKVINGCVPFPAVDIGGNTGGGLANTGDSNGQCSSSTGQIYVRSGTNSNGVAAVMYSWYFPKDSPSSGLGHRHDWEAVIVYLRDPLATTAANIIAVCPSAHGAFDCTTTPQLSGTRPKIQYESVWPVNHALAISSTTGGSQPMVAWESLPAVAAAALENTDFGSANVPFKNGNFNNNLARAVI